MTSETEETVAVFASRWNGGGDKLRASALIARYVAGILAINKTNVILNGANHGSQDAFAETYSGHKNSSGLTVAMYPNQDHTTRFEADVRRGKAHEKLCSDAIERTRYMLENCGAYIVLPCDATVLMEMLLATQSDESRMPSRHGLLITTKEQNDALKALDRSLTNSEWLLHNVETCVIGTQKDLLSAEDKDAEFAFARKVMTAVGNFLRLNYGRTF